MSVSKLYLYDFTAPNVYETFFYNASVGKTTCFYFCPCFRKEFLKGLVLHESVIYEQKKEVACCCLHCRFKLISSTNYREEPSDFLDELKKLLIQHFLLYGQ